MPPPGQRYVAATWIAVAGAVVTVLVGTVAVLAVRDSLPERIVLRWDELQPDLTLDLHGVLLLAASVALVGCAAFLVLGVVLHRSIRHGFAGYALGFALGVGGGIYALAVGQAAENTNGEPPWMLVAFAVGFGAGYLLTRWVREPVLRPSDTVPPPDSSLAVPESARLAWNGWVRPGFAMRVSFLSLWTVALTGFYWWVGFPSWVMAAPFFGALVGQLVATRRRQFAIDYSGAGLRGKYGGLPSPIHLSDITSAEVISISALRDFGGWGNVTAPDGRQGWITRSGEALVVHRHSKPDFVVTVDGADEAAAVLNTLVARLRAQTIVDLPHPYGDRMASPAD